MTNLAPLIAAVLFIFTILSVYFSYRKWRKYIWEISAVRLVMIVISGIVSIFVSGFAAKLFSDSIYNAVQENVPAENLQLLLEAFPSYPTLIEVIVAFIVTPLIFMVAFSTIRSFLFVFAPILTRLLAKITKTDNIDYYSDNEEDDSNLPGIFSGKKGYYARVRSIAGGIIGAVSALVVCVFAMAPITGFFEVCGNIAGDVASTKSETLEEYQEVIETAEAVCNNGYNKTINAIGGRAIYRNLTTATIGDTETTFEKEIDVASSVARAVLIFNSDSSKEDITTAIKEVENSFENSALLPTLMSEFLSGAATSWEKGEAFCEIDAPSVGSNEQLNAFLLTVYGAFESSSQQTVKDDISTIADIFVLVVENDIIDIAEENPEAILENSEFIEAVLLEFMYNERLVTIIGSAVDLGIDMLSEFIGIPENLDGKYEALITDLAGVETKDKISDYAKDVKAVFNKYGIAITSESAEVVANTIITSSNGSPITEALITSVLKNNNITILGPKDEISSICLSNAVIFESTTTLITAKLITSKNADSVKDPAGEAKALADIFASVIELKDMNFENIKIGETLSTIGNALDKFASTELIGKECVDSLFIALLQTDKIGSTIRMNATDAYNFATTLTGGKSGSYKEMMISVGKTVDTISNVSSNESLTVESVTEVLSTITPETAEALSQIITPDLIKDFGVNEESAEATSDILSNTLTKLADAKSEMSDEEFKKETDAITDLINIAMGSTNSENENDVFGEESQTGLTVTEYVDRISNSEIISDVLIETVYGENDEPVIDPLGAEIELGEEGEEELINALNEKYNSSSEEDEEETKKLINAIAAFMNIGIVITEDGVSRG